MLKWTIFYFKKMLYLINLFNVFNDFSIFMIFFKCFVLIVLNSRDMSQSYVCLDPDCTRWKFPFLTLKMIKELSLIPPNPFNIVCRMTNRSSHTLSDPPPPRITLSLLSNILFLVIFITWSHMVLVTYTSGVTLIYKTCFICMVLLATIFYLCLPMSTSLNCHSSLYFTYWHFMWNIFQKYQFW